MVQMKKLAQSTYLLDCGEIPVFLMPQVAYLLLDDMPVLIEPGCTTAASRLLSESSKLGIDLKKLSYIIPTHIHVDHGGGAGYLAQNLPQAKVVLHPKGAAHMVDPSRLIQSTRLIFGENCLEAFGPILPVPQDQIHVAKDGEVIPLGKRDLRISFSPGHASHHISILDSLTNGLFCGEALGFPLDTMSDILLPAGVPPFDPELYVESIYKLEKLSPELLFYSHIGARSDAGKRIEGVKKNSIAFGEIIGKAVEAGEDDQRILERLSEYVKGYSSKAEISGFQLTLSGYIDYFRNKK